MSPETCTRVREAAAFGDGRMWRDAELLEHAEHCDACRKEFQARKTQREFKDAFPVLASIAAEGDRPSVSRSGKGEAQARRRRISLILLAALSVVGFIIQQLSPRNPAASTIATGVPFFRISNLENALFESKVEGGAIRSSMTRGAAAFHVEPLGPGQSFVLTLPDGDLDVRGTRFVVRIENGKTQSVEVAEGAVALRLKGRPEMTLKAGQSWPDARAARPMGSFFPVTPASPRNPKSPEPAKPGD